LKVLILPRVPQVLVATPFVQSRQDVVDRMISMAYENGALRGSKAVDIGSGDGRIVIALAKAGFEAHGYEINLPLVVYSWCRIWRHGLSGTAFVHWESMFNVDFSVFAVVTWCAAPWHARISGLPCSDVCLVVPVIKATLSSTLWGQRCKVSDPRNIFGLAFIGSLYTTV
jgi:hypothetical protein